MESVFIIYFEGVLSVDVKICTVDWQVCLPNVRKCWLFCLFSTWLIRASIWFMWCLLFGHIVVLFYSFMWVCLGWQDCYISTTPYRTNVWHWEDVSSVPCVWSWHLVNPKSLKLHPRFPHLCPFLASESLRLRMHGEAALVYPPS